MNKQIVTCLTTLTLFASVAHAEAVKIGAGSDGEYANIIVPAINKALQQAYGYSAVAETSEGTQEDIEKLKSGQIVAALTQLDVAALNMTYENDPNEDLLLLWGRIVPKALFCVAHRNGRVATYDDLTDDEQKTPLNISVGNKKGGTALTFQYLMKLDPNLSRNHITFYHKGKTRVEINRLISGRRDLVCFLAMPDPANEIIMGVAEHDELFFISFNNPIFDKVQIGKNRIYEIVEVPVTSGFWGFNQKKVKTIVTWVGMLVNENKIDEKLLNALSTVVMKPDLLEGNTLSAKAKRVFDKTLDQIEGWMD